MSSPTIPPSQSSTAAATTGPASGPRPASSTPTIIGLPRSTQPLVAVRVERSRDTLHPYALPVGLSTPLDATGLGGRPETSHPPRALSTTLPRLIKTQRFEIRRASW